MKNVNDQNFFNFVGDLTKGNTVLKIEVFRIINFYIFCEITIFFENGSIISKLLNMNFLNILSTEYD